MSNRDKNHIRDALGISMATVNNWIKTGVIPAPDVHNSYSETTYNAIIESVKSNSQKLNGRANRSLVEEKYISYLGISCKERKELLNSLIELYEDTKLTISEGVLSLAIAVLKSNSLIGPEWENSPKTRIERLLKEWAELHQASIDVIKNTFSAFNIQNKDDDLIGAFYQSIQSIAQRSFLGSYYTPAELLADITVSGDKSVLDPCCGSGGILLKVLNKNHDSSKIFARDIDPIALKICSLNLALFFNDPNFKSTIEKCNITEKAFDDLFQIKQSIKFDCIITNPPWGSKLPKTERNKLVQSYPELATTEIFSIALSNGIDDLSDSGKLLFFLPHSILNVATHKNIRKKLLNTKGAVSIQLLGNAFVGVLSEGILLEIDKSASSGSILIRDRSNATYHIHKGEVASPSFIIAATSSDVDDEIIKKIYDREHTNLKADTIFALGIVTGSNEKHILSQFSAQSEPIFRGKDIVNYRYTEPSCFIEFNPEIYQQVAPVEYYRQKKIVYRFISDRIICALDEKNSLVLNSANLFIPRHYPMESVVCLFNNPIYTYLYRKKFHSRKLLKSHLQALPLPILTEEIHAELKLKHSGIVSGDNWESLDLLIANIFALSNKEFSYIKESINGKA